MRVAQVSCWIDPEARDADELLSAWTTLSLVAGAAAGAGVDVTVLQAAASEARFVRDDVRYHFVAENSPSRLRRRAGTWAWPLPGALARALALARPDIIHFNGLSFPRQARLLHEAVPGARLLVQDHADQPPPSWRAGIHRQGLATVEAVAFTAAAQAAPFAAVLPAHTRIFEIAESSTRFEPGDRDMARSESGIGGDPCLLWVGHLDANKDPVCVLDALSVAAAELPDARLWMCYRAAPLLDTVRRRIAGDAVLRGRVHLLGDQPHGRIETLLRAADFLVQASHVEGSGYAVLEALACGTVPLVTDIPSFRVLTDGGRHGSLTPAGDARAMAGAWIDWARRDRSLLRAAARAHFEQRLSLEALGRSLRDAYSSMLNDEGRRDVRESSSTE